MFLQSFMPMEDIMEPEEGPNRRIMQPGARKSGPRFLAEEIPMAIGYSGQQLAQHGLTK